MIINKGKELAVKAATAVVLTTSIMTVVGPAIVNADSALISKKPAIKTFAQVCELSGAALAGTTKDMIPAEPMKISNYYEIANKKDGDLSVDILQLKNLDSATQDKVNKEIYDFITEEADFEEESEYEAFYSIIPNSDTVFSLVLCKDQAYDRVATKFYTFDTKTGLQLTNKEIAKLAGIDESDFNAYALASAQNTTNKVFVEEESDEKAFVDGKLNPKSALAEESENGTEEGFVEAYTDKSLNINMPMFLDSKGQLWMFSSICFSYGAGYYECAYNHDGDIFGMSLTNPEEEKGLITDSAVLYCTTISADENDVHTAYKTVEESINK